MQTNLSIIGAGNVSHSLLPALINAGFKIEYIFSKSGKSAKQLSSIYGLKHTSDLRKIRTSVIILTISDSAIEEVLKEIEPDPQRIILHTSGSTSIDLITRYHNNAGVLYPLQTFTKSKTLDFKEIPICIEASGNKNMEFIEYLADKISNRVVKLNSDQRLALHTAAVFACNFTNLMYTLGDEILQKANINFNILHPLIMETASKAVNYKPNTIQTGPAVRNDLVTISKHIDILDKEKGELYKTLSGVIKNRYFDNDKP